MCSTGNEFHLRHVKLRCPWNMQKTMKKEDRNMVELGIKGRTDLRPRDFHIIQIGIDGCLRSVRASIQKDVYVNSASGTSQF